MNKHPEDPHPELREFMTELFIRRAGGVFFAVYRNRSVIDFAGEMLRQHLPESFSRSAVFSGEEGVPVFFERNMGSWSSGGHVFHIIDAEKPSRRFLQDFFDYLNYTRGKFRTHPRSMVFWMTPDFERKLFRAAPDLEFFISGRHDFSKFAVFSGKMKTTPEKQPGRIVKQPSIHPDIRKYLETAIRQHQHRGEFLKKGVPFILKPMSRLDPKESYEPLRFMDRNGRRVQSDIYMRRFIESEKESVLIVTGDSGSGKTIFSLHAFVHSAKKYLETGTGPIPVFISLETYQQGFDLKGIVQNEFYKHLRIDPATGVFQKLAAKGRFLFFVDGYDGAASSGSLKMMIENLKTLLRLRFEKKKGSSDKNDSGIRGNRVILTCRTRYCIQDVHFEKKRISGFTELFRPYANTHGVRFVRILPSVIPPKRLETIIRTNNPGEVTEQALVEIVRDGNTIRDICGERFLSDLILKTVSSLKNTHVNLSDLYRTYTDEWIMKDDWRFLLKPEGKKVFMWKLAIKMYKRRGDYAIHREDLDAPQRKHIKARNGYRNVDLYAFETRTCDFVSLDEKQVYRFIHPSLVEYFLAEYFFHMTRCGFQKDISYADFNPATKFFFKEIIRSNRKNLRNIDLSGINLDRVELCNADFRGARLQRTQFCEANLTGADFSEADLTRANLRQSKIHRSFFREAKLVQAEMTESELISSDLTRADLQRARLNSANLSGVRLRQAQINDADLTKAELRRADLSGADMRWVNLQRARFSQADLTGATLLKARLGEADFTEAILRKTNLSDTDMTRVIVKRADLKWANLSKANLSESNFQEADLTRANLQKANLQRADFSKSTLVRANLIKADIRWADLRNSDLTDADLWQANMNEADLSGATYDKVLLSKAFAEEAKLD